MSIPEPGSAGWHNDRGNTLCDEFRFGEAIGEYERAIALSPDFAEAYSNMGTALRDCGRIEEAIAAHQHALQLRPNLAEAMNNLAIALRDTGQWEKALQCCRRAIEMKPDYAEAHANLGVILAEMEQSEEAIAACRRAVALQPKRGVLQCNLGMILLKLGHYEEGWPQVEWRYFADPRYPARQIPKPRWYGEDLQGRTLLIHAEQGFGDTIQFARYVPLAVAHGGRVIFECYPEQRSLFECLPNVSQFITAGEPLPEFDLHCPIMSLPLAFRTTLDSIPTQPYLRPDPKLTEYWRHRIDAVHVYGKPSRRKIGLVWAGKPTHTDDRNRSMGLSQLAPLAQVDATFYSLQKGIAAEQASTPPAGMVLHDFSNGFSDYAQTAAFIANLDLVIAVDTSAAHLAAAMGKPVYMLLPKIADWRWMIQREDTPWYPTMRLFRQQNWRDWSYPIEKIVALLNDSQEF
ncbi:MAG TPA: tetratricopeptide repeat-containing glycosyltransferase family protein [Tepidisphaeraceae bacterium]